MGEGQAGIGAGKGRVEPQGRGEEMLRLLVFGLGEAVHVPEAAVIGLQALSELGAFSMARLRSTVSISAEIDDTMLLPISSSTAKRSSGLRSKVSAQTILAVRTSISSTLTIRWPAMLRTVPVAT